MASALLITLSFRYLFHLTSTFIHFIFFCSIESAQLGIDKYEGSQAFFADGTLVRVGWAKRNSRLHVSNLDENTTERDLIDLFTR